LGKLGKPGDRLREYRGYLGMTLEEIEEWSGVKGSAWSYAETEGKGISSKILEALSTVEPPRDYNCTPHWVDGYTDSNGIWHSGHISDC
jgi:transcriptional regulator with XRE-family HTH domain